VHDIHRGFGLHYVPLKTVILIVWIMFLLKEIILQ